MSGASEGRESPTYPSPTLVVGLGRFGLAVLEELGEDWAWVSQTGADPSRKNLRLVHVRPEGDGDEAAWRAGEKDTLELAHYINEGDLPSRAVDLAILRSLGLVRFRDGVYQVALPRDVGILEVEPDQTGYRNTGLGEGSPERKTRTFRRRFFEWLNLSPDPVVSADRLRELFQQEPQLDLFCTPIINRVRQGHAPGLLLLAIGRCRALSEGRDPSPWGWLKHKRWGGHLSCDEDGVGRVTAIGGASLEDPRRQRFERFLSEFTPEPFAKWTEYARNVQSGAVPAAEPVPAVLIPPPLVPGEEDLASQIDLRTLLQVDWERAGWARDHADAVHRVRFSSLPAGEFRLGLFDHDSIKRSPEEWDRLAERYRELGTSLHRGLVRLWIDLQRSGARAQASMNEPGRRRENLVETIEQSLEILGELVVRAVLGAAAEQPSTGSEEAWPRETDRWIDGAPLPGRASQFLRSHVVAERHDDTVAARLLEQRLVDLGLGDPDAHRALERRLLVEVPLEPPGGQVDPDHEPENRSEDLRGFREQVNRAVRELYHLPFLSEYRDRPTRLPARLTVWVVGDLAEPFTRTTCKTVLRELHAELLRALGPIFDQFRSGFDRALSIVPVLWMPHPPDSFGGRYPVENRLEEAAIIDAVHEVRRWVESVPQGTRCVPQMFISGKVTDNAVLGQHEAVQQTRNFLSLLTRNDQGKDDLLRRIAVGVPESNVFSSFACFLIDFPARRAREYLASRLAREALERLEEGEGRGEVDPIDPAAFQPPAPKELVKSPSKALAKALAPRAEGVAHRVEAAAGPLDLETEAARLVRVYDERFEDGLLSDIHATWQDLIRSRGVVDELAGSLRQETAARRASKQRELEKTADKLVVQDLVRGGARQVVVRFSQLAARARERLSEAERHKRDFEGSCLAHRLPGTDPIGPARKKVQSEAAEKPSWSSIRAGLVVWGLMALALGAPIFLVLARLLAPDGLPGPWGLVLERGAPLLGLALLLPPARWLLVRHVRGILDRIRKAIERLGKVARRVVEGTPDSPLALPASIRSFFEARLRLTAALASREFAQAIADQASRDHSMVGRLQRSLRTQQHQLQRRLEQFGVRPRLQRSATPDAETDDLSHLFARRSGDVPRLLDPERLHQYYQEHAGDRDRRGEQALQLVDEAGGLEGWRVQACLSDQEQVLGYGRRYFAEIVAEPVSAQPDFREEAGQKLIRFLAAHYSNIGFGAKFIGYEGLDPNGITTRADADVLMHEALVQLMEQTNEELRSREDPLQLSRTLRPIKAAIDPNSAYMLSLAQDIAGHCIRNIRRFESFLDRMQTPAGRLFPVTGEAVMPERRMPINRLSGRADLRTRLNAVVLGGRRSTDPPLPELETAEAQTPPEGPAVTAEEAPQVDESPPAEAPAAIEVSPSVEEPEAIEVPPPAAVPPTAAPRPPPVSSVDVPEPEALTEPEGRDIPEGDDA